MLLAVLSASLFCEILKKLKYAQPVQDSAPSWAYKWDNSATQHMKMPCSCFKLPSPTQGHGMPALRWHRMRACSQRRHLAHQFSLLIHRRCRKVVWLFGQRMMAPFSVSGPRSLPQTLCAQLPASQPWSRTSQPSLREATPWPGGAGKGGCSHVQVGLMA